MLEMLQKMDCYNQSLSNVQSGSLIYALQLLWYIIIYLNALRISEMLTRKYESQNAPCIKNHFWSYFYLFKTLLVQTFMCAFVTEVSNVDILFFKGILFAFHFC